MIESPNRIPVAGPWITDREPELAAEAAREAWYSNHYAYNVRFEDLVSQYTATAFAVSLPHCTAALHLSLAAHNIGPGDEVIVPDVTWIASVAPVTYVGATPVLVDIDPETWCLAPKAVETAIGPKTKAIIGVDLYGSMCDWDALCTIAEKNNLVLIEDSAEALGSAYKGHRAGSFGRAGTFSFHGSKTVATGEGGMLVTHHKEVIERVLFLRDHGRPPGDRQFINSELAFKYRMSAVQAALGIAQMERIDDLIAKKRQIFSWYNEQLNTIDGITYNAEPEGVFNSYWMVTIIPDPDYGIDKYRLMEEFFKRNIDTRPFFSQLSTLPAFEGRQASTRFVSDNDKGAIPARYGINLPSGYNITAEDTDLIVRALKEILHR